MHTVFYTQRTPLGGWFPVTIHSTFVYDGREYHVCKLRDNPQPAIFDVREPNQLKRVDELSLSEIVYVPRDAK